MDFMLKVFGWLQFGPLKGYRTQVLGIATALSGLIMAVATWSVGDLSLAEALKAIGEYWIAIVSGFGLWFGGAKVNALLEKKK